MAITIAYQGIFGSNSHTAALEMAEKLGIPAFDTIEAITSAGVVAALQNGSAQYGVVATHNIIAGEVLETTAALATLPHTVLCNHTLPIHHCLFAKQAGIPPTTIASHIQALGQCKFYLAQYYPAATQEELADTALGARYLSDGTLPDSTAVLCRKNAGEHFGLVMLAENVEDLKENRTDFILFECIK